MTKSTGMVSYGTPPVPPKLQCPSSVHVHPHGQQVCPPLQHIALAFGQHPYTNVPNPRSQHVCPDAQWVEGSKK